MYGSVCLIPSTPISWVIFVMDRLVKKFLFCMDIWLYGREVPLPDRIIGSSGALPQPRNVEELPRTQLSTIFDYARAVLYMNKYVLDAPGPVCSAIAFMTKSVTLCCLQRLFWANFHQVGFYKRNIDCKIYDITVSYKEIVKISQSKSCILHPLLNCIYFHCQQEYDRGGIPLASSDSSHAVGFHFLCCWTFYHLFLSGKIIYFFHFLSQL